MAREFRTVIEPVSSPFKLNHDSSIAMLGSCFTNNIGSRLTEAGFDVSVNEMGILFNPASIANLVNRALERKWWTVDDLVEWNGTYHCLDLESRRQSQDVGELLNGVNGDLEKLAQKLTAADVWFVTFGTAWVFEYTATGMLVGNCHKLPNNCFERRRMSVAEIVDMWLPLCQGRRVVFTVSPVRHLADGLHGNTVSKATLHVAIEELVEKAGATYFPAYEIVNDDLRDYRFYDADMKHPSAVACEYIYERFAQTYFDKSTAALADEYRRKARQCNHRPIL
jgi:hypothetical protein